MVIHHNLLIPVFRFRHPNSSNFLNEGRIRRNSFSAVFLARGMSWKSGDSVGPYRIVAFLNSGTQKNAFHAVSTSGEDVALMILKEPREAKAFQNEAQKLRSLDHPGIVRILDFDFDHSTPYIVEELLGFDTLKDRLRGALSWRETIDLGEQLADALAYAHAHDVIHRDLKPDNIIALPNGHVKIIDFGLAKAALAPWNTPNRGPFQYMAPEQWRWEPINPRADIYALGCVLFECLYGYPAFDRDRSIDGPRERAAVRVARSPDLPLPLIELIESCLEEDVHNRLIAAEDLALAFAWLRGVIFPPPLFISRFPSTSTMTLETPPDDPDFRPYRAKQSILRGRDRFSQGKRAQMAEAAAAFRQALIENPQDAEAMAWLATTMSEQYYFGWGADRDSLSEAERLAEHAQELDPTNAAAYFALVKIAWNTGHLGRAYREGRAAIRANPESRMARHAAALGCVYAGVANEAIPIAQQLVESDPTDREARYRLGEAYQLAGRYAESLTVLETHMRKYSWIGVAYETAAIDLLHLGQPQRAKEILDQQRSHHTLGNPLFVGDVLTLTGDVTGARAAWEDGVREYEESLRLHPRPRGQAWLAMLYARLGANDTARAAIAIALHAEPGNSYILYRAACTSAMLGEPSRAVEFLIRAMEAGWTNAEMLGVEETSYLRDIADDERYREARTLMEDRSRKELS